jgi:hypothetical protein
MLFLYAFHGALRAVPLLATSSFSGSAGIWSFCDKFTGIIKPYTFPAPPEWEIVRSNPRKREEVCYPGPRRPPLGDHRHPVSVGGGGFAGILAAFPAPCRQFSTELPPYSKIPYSPDIPASDKVGHSPAILSVNQYLVNVSQL